jgi:FKBP-type peptidyl-prolyl cis-trans isomerase
MKFLLLISLLLALLSCNNNEGNTKERRRPDENQLVELNRHLIAKDRERIESFIERKNLNMTETQSGLWYNIVNEGEGETFRYEDRIIMEYECTLLDGTPCYSSSVDGPKEIILGKTRIEAGLDQGLRFLRPGAEAMFIIPPFLAWGLPGDGRKIPPRAVVVYKVKIPAAE